MKKIKFPKGLKGYISHETIIMFLMFIFISVVGTARFSDVINKTRELMLLRDFSVIKTACMQMLYENDGFGDINAADFYKYFNQHIDSDNRLADDNKTFGKKDPWKVPYEVGFKQISPAETTITISSVGRYKKPRYVLLAHYKDGEVRVGTAGFNSEEGANQSDALVVDNEAKITNMWAN